MNDRRFGACQGPSGRVVTHLYGPGLPGLSQANSVQNVEATARGVTHHFLCCYLVTQDWSRPSGPPPPPPHPFHAHPLEVPHSQAV